MAAVPFIFSTVPRKSTCSPSEIILGTRYVDLPGSWDGVTTTFLRALTTLKFHSKSEQGHTQLEKIVSLCSENNIKLCVEVGRNFYVLDPVSVTKPTNVVEDGKLLSLGLDYNVKL